MTQPSLTGLDAGRPLKPTPKSKRKGDHKRKARPIAPATVTVLNGEVVVVIPDVLGKNESHKSGRYLSKATTLMRQAVHEGASVRGAGRAPFRQTTVGPWRAEVLGVWPRLRGRIEGMEMDFVAPVGDADAPIAQAFDALKHAGIIDDDARIVDVRGFNLYRKGERWTVIRLVRVDDLATRDAAIAHLVDLLPPPIASAAPPVASKRRKR